MDYSDRMLRREIDVTRRLPAAVPAPALLHSYDDGDWVVGVFHYVAGRVPGQPWNAHDLRRVTTAARDLGELPLTDALRELPPAADSLRTEFDAWQRLAAAPALASTRPDLDAWSTAHLDELAALESRWPELVRGDALVHLDVRSDNILIQPDGRVVLSRLIEWRHLLIVVQPDTLIRWHRKGFQLFWRWK